MKILIPILSFSSADDYYNYSDQIYRIQEYGDSSNYENSNFETLYENIEAIENKKNKKKKDYQGQHNLNTLTFFKTFSQGYQHNFRTLFFKINAQDKETF